jgi:hypothetical protein
MLNKMIKEKKQNKSYFCTQVHTEQHTHCTQEIKHTGRAQRENALCGINTLTHDTVCCYKMRPSTKVLLSPFGANYISIHKNNL